MAHRVFVGPGPLRSGRRSIRGCDEIDEERLLRGPTRPGALNPADASS